MSRLQFGHRERGQGRQDQRRGSGDLRGGHRPAAEVAVGAVAQGRVDAHPGRRQVDRVRAVVGPAGEPVVVVGGRDADLARAVVSARIAAHPFFVVVVAGVAGGGDEQDVVRAERVDLVGERLRVGGPGERRRVVDHADVHAGLLRGDQPLQRFDQPAGFAPRRGAQPLDRQDRRLPVHPRHADAVVGDGAHDPGDVRAVAAVDLVVVQRFAVVLEHAVAVRARRAAADAAGVAPHVGREIRVVVVDARVGLADHDRAAAGGHSPRLQRAIVGARRAGRLRRRAPLRIPAWGSAGRCCELPIAARRRGRSAWRWRVIR